MNVKSKNQLKREEKQNRIAYFKGRKKTQELTHVSMVGNNMCFIDTGNLEHGVYLLSKQSEYFAAVISGDKVVIDKYVNLLISLKQNG